MATVMTKQQSEKQTSNNSLKKHQCEKDIQLVKLYNGAKKVLLNPHNYLLPDGYKLKSKLNPFFQWLENGTIHPVERLTFLADAVGEAGDTFGMVEPFGYFLFSASSEIKERHLIAVKIWANRQ